MHLLVLPEYDTSTRHVVVDTVYSALLPASGATVSHIRPAPGARTVAIAAAPWGETGRLVTFPYEPHRTPIYNGARAWRRWRWVGRALSTFDDAPPDAVLARNDLIASRRALAFARRHRLPFIFQVSSPDAEFRINGAGPRRPARAGFERARGLLDRSIRRGICRRATVVLPISAAMRRYMVDVEQVEAARVFSFPMGAGSQPVLDPDGAARVRARFGLPVGRTVVYSGVIDPIRSPEFMLDVLAAVQATLPDVVLLVITGQRDGRRAAFEKAVSRRRLPVVVVGPLDHAEVPLFLQAADVAISPYPPRLEHAMCSPTKTIEAMAVGLPVVGNEEVNEQAHVLRASQGGIAVPFDVRAFAAATVRYLEDPRLRCHAGANGRAWALAHRGYERLTAYLLAIVETALAGGNLAALPHEPD